MKKIVLSVIALTALSSAAFAGSAFENAMKRNMVEFPDHYTAVIGDGYAAGNALAIETGLTGSINSAGPGEDLSHNRR